MSDPRPDAPVPEARRGRAGALGLVALFAAATLLRLAVVGDLAPLPSMHALVEDAAAYDAAARQLLASGGVPEAAFYQDPLYPYLLAACYAAFGHSFTAVRVVPALVGGVTAVLLALAGRRLGGRAAGWIAGILAAAYAPLLFYVPLLLKETFLVLLVSAFLLTALAALGGERRGWSAAAGLLLGLATLLRGNLLLVAPVAAAALGVSAARHAASRAAAWRTAAAFALGFALALLPVTVLNARASGEWILTTSQGGANFYIGNHRGASGLYEPLRPGRHTPAEEQEDARRLAAEIRSAEAGTAVEPASLSPAEVSRVLWRAAWRDVAAAPGSWLRSLGRKTLYFWSAAEIPDAEAFDVYRLESPWLTWDPVTFSLLAPLGLAGIVLLWRREGGRLLALLTAALTVSVALFFVFARYRLPVVPLLVAAAGAGLPALAVAWRRRDRRRLVAWAATAAAALVLARWPLFDAGERRAWAAVTHGNLATAANRLGAEAAASDPERAWRWYGQGERHGRAALAADPAYLPAQLTLAVNALRRGNLLLAAGRREEAAAAYAAAQAALDALLASPAAGDYPELVENARERLGRALAASRAAAARDGANRGL